MNAAPTRKEQVPEGVCTDTARPYVLFFLSIYLYTCTFQRLRAKQWSLFPEQVPV